MKIPTNSALIIIDLLNDFNFNHGHVLAEKTNQIIQPLKTLKNEFKKNSFPVIYVNDHFNLWQADLAQIIKYCLNPLNEMIIQELKPNIEDYFLIKPKHSAFYGTGLDILLHQLNIDTLVLTGIAGNICVLFTANDAYMRDYKIIAPSDCIASVDDNDQKYALTMMANVLKAKVISSNQIGL